MNEPLENLFEEHRITAFFSYITSAEDKNLNAETVMIQSYLTFG